MTLSMKPHSLLPNDCLIARGFTAQRHPSVARWQPSTCRSSAKLQRSMRMRSGRAEGFHFWGGLEKISGPFDLCVRACASVCVRASEGRDSSSAIAHLSLIYSPLERIGRWFAECMRPVLKMISIRAAPDIDTKPSAQTHTQRHTL